mmetsp:Transcript_35972/g.86832  ORF Transcript_35972/g.86832 Transcript_35972/m.86832 type:complete len:637 (-) Transcript_35972:527-2437(-)
MRAVYHCRSSLFRRRRLLPLSPVSSTPLCHSWSRPIAYVVVPSTTPTSQAPLSSKGNGRSVGTQIFDGHVFSTRQIHASSPSLSDNLLGHSPMARTIPTTSQQAAAPPSPGNQGPSWGVDANTAGGGVWAQTSAKKDKLNELLTELNSDGVDTGAKGMETLDEYASAQEKLDLQFADGLKIIAKFVDVGTKNSDHTMIVKNASSISVGTDASKAAENATDQVFQLLESASSLEEWEKPKFEATMHEILRILSTGLPPEPNIKNPVAGSLDISSPLCYLREFVEDSSGGTSDKVHDGANHQSPDYGEIEQQIELLDNIVTEAFSSSINIYRTLLLRATSQTLLDNWDTLTTVTNGDIDRAAVSKVSILPQRPTVNAKKILKIFDAYANESSQEWVKSWWELIDADGDGLIDEEEMNNCITLASKPIHTALSDLVYLSLEVCPVRTAGLGNSDEANDAWFLGGENFSDFLDNNISSIPNPSAGADLNKKLSWKNRRRELKARKALIKTFQASLARHFRDQVETAHRLRCIYAWAEKSHQDNKLDSILVDASEEWGAASSLVGRKRYVELTPKISYPEFHKEQSRHFPHLDRIGEEIAMSFKEDLWVSQGKGRQNKELKRDCFLFLSGVSLIDVGIGFL